VDNTNDLEQFLSSVAPVVLEDLGAVAMILDLEQRVRWASTAAARLMGYHKSHVAGRPHPETGTTSEARAGEALAATLERGEDVVRGLPTVYLTTTGQELLATVDLYIVRNGWGRMIASLEVVKSCTAAAGDNGEHTDHVEEQEADFLAGAWNGRPAWGSPEGVLKALLDHEEPLKAMERCVIQETLRRCGWRVQEAASRLGISRITLWRRMKEHGIERGERGKMDP